MARPYPWLLPLVLGAATALASPSARAQTAEELAAARQVFNEGKALEGKSQWAQALEKFKQVATVKMTPQVRFHVALCEEHLGKLVSAIRGFDLAAEEAKAAGSAAAEVEKLAPERAAALRGRVAKLRLEVTGKLIDSRVLVDDVAVAGKEPGLEVMVDPGSHVVEVKDRDGKSTFRKEVTLAEKADEKVEVPVDDHEPAPVAPVTPPPAPPPPSRTPVWIAGSLGAAAFAGAAVFWVLRGNTLTELGDHCGPNYTNCDPAYRDTEARGKTYGTASGVLLGVGIAGAVTAVGFLVVPLFRKPAAAPQPPVTSLRLVPTGTGVQLVGAF